MWPAALLLLQLAQPPPAPAAVEKEDRAQEELDSARRRHRWRAVGLGGLALVAASALPCTPVYPCVGLPMAFLVLRYGGPAGPGMHDTTLRTMTTCAAGSCLPYVVFTLAGDAADAWEQSR